tara:strand:+ start:2854 stop:3969 length:1116 start_codon:yes stop_codon:yes gene_type:complete
MLKNLHCYQSEMVNESRIFKVAKTVSKSFDEILLAGIGEKNLPLEFNLSDKIKIIRSNHFNLDSKIIRLFIYFLWSNYLIIKIKPKVLTIHSLELLPLLTIAKLMGIKVIYDAHELETEKNGMKGIRKKISKIIERLYIKYCDEVVVVSEEIAVFYKELYSSQKKPTVIMNLPYKLKEKVIKNDIFKEAYNLKKNDLVFLYQGLLGKGRGIENIIEAFENIADKSKVVVFMGYGTLEDDIKKAAAKNANIFFKNAVNPNVVLNYTSSADVGLSLIENTCLSYYFCLPNKLFEYSQAEIPTIVSSNIEMKKIVETYEIGYVLEKNSSNELLKTIEKITKDEILAYHDNLILFKNKYHWEMQENKIIELYILT